MKKTLLVALALILTALPTLAGADGFFALSGTVDKIGCTESPTLGSESTLQCAIAVAPDPGLAAEVTVYCLDPNVAAACSEFQSGDAVMVYGSETRNTKVVEKIGHMAKPSK